MSQEKVEDYVGHEDKWGNVGDFADKLAPGTRGEEEFGKVTRVTTFTSGIHGSLLVIQVWHIFFGAFLCLCSRGCFLE